jgi:2'-phosphotransferase
MKVNKKNLSRTLTGILRFNSINKGLDMNEEGYVLLSDIMTLMNLTYDDITSIVKNDSKQRFGMIKINNIWFIRANNGHSKKVCDYYRLNPNSMFTILNEPLDECLHGTTHIALENIMKEGLGRGERGYIHMAKGFPGDPNVKSGGRANSEIWIKVNMYEAMIAGYIFYISENGVILTNTTLRPEFLTVVKRK